MENTGIAYDRLIARFVKWAEKEENIRAAFVIGSRARVDDHPADEWSDLDVIVLVEDHRVLIDDPGWLHQIGNPRITFVERTPDGEAYELRVLFDGGLDVDFAPDPIVEFRRMLKEGFTPLYQDLMGRGVRFLVDKDQLTDELVEVNVARKPWIPPDEGEFLNLCNDFWYHTVWTAKKLRRGELWWGKSCCDNYLKHLLLRMLEWQARLSQPNADTWMRGRFLEEWADARLVAALPALFAHYNSEDVWRALFATLNGFRIVAIEAAQKLGYLYPAEADKYATKLVDELFKGREIK
ncbi:MAG: aminoglycoside 6-adenylyltransferase [Anaerolineales bacterium]|nr:aminoglycoside 6-adenylyltransferase [Anaerolineales bacterium]